MISKVKRFVGVIFILIGLIIAIGSGETQLTVIQILLQGVSGIFIMYLGCKISSVPKGATEIITNYKEPKNNKNSIILNKAISDFRLKAKNKTGKTIPIIIYMKKTFASSLRDRDYDIYHGKKETFDGWPVEFLPEDSELDFEIFKN